MGKSPPHRTSRPTNATAAVQSGHRDRATTEAQLLAAAIRLLHRNGVLAGLNLREVADAAGINRGLIYQYFGSRRALLRAAIEAMAWHREPLFHQGRILPFAQRRLHVFRLAIQKARFIKMEALLALDGDEQLRLFPRLHQTRLDLQKDRASGYLAPDVDPLMAHVLTAATYLGYAVFRETLAREVNLAPEVLDQRVEVVFARMLQGLMDRLDSGGDPPDSSPGTESSANDQV